MLYRLSAVGITIAIGMLNLSMLYGNHGVAYTRKLRNELAVQQTALQLLENNIAALTHEVALLKTYPLSLEEKARATLGLIKRNEKFMQIVELD